MKGWFPLHAKRAIPLLALILFAVSSCDNLFSRSKGKDPPPSYPGLSFDLTGDGTAYLVKSDGATGNVIIPAEYNGKPVTQIAPNGFMNCTGLTSITIPNSVTTIGMSAFMLCTGLTSLTIPNSVKFIRTDAFAGCRNLSNITMGESVREISVNAFSSCGTPSGLTITILALSPPEWGAGNIFYGTVINNIYVPSSVVGIYQGTAGWTNFASQISAIVP